MRIVLDVNVLVSALMSSRGAPAQILSYWQAGRLELLVSPAIIEELERVIRYPRIRTRLRIGEEQIQRFLYLLRHQAIGVNPAEEIKAIALDPTDNRFLECALAGKADIIVSGDHHLLLLGQYRGIQVLTPAGFLALLALEKRIP